MSLKLVCYTIYVLIFESALCPSISPPENGTYVTGDDRQQPAGKNITFACRFDYILVGSATITCQDDGTWNTSPPMCTAGKLILGWDRGKEESMGSFFKKL